MGRGRIRLLAFQVRCLGVGVLEAADADPHDRVVHGDLRSRADELAAPARGAVEPAAVAEDVVTHVRHGQRPGDGDDADRNGQQDPAPAPGEDRRDHDARDERRVAGLGVREVEAGPDPGDRERAADDDAPVAHEQHCYEAGEDGDHQETPVDRGVPEDRVHAVERRERVRDVQLRVPEDVAVLVLVDPDCCEEECHRRHLREQPEHPEPRPRQPRENDREQPEREEEEEQLDRALADVLRPEDREPAPADEGGERPCDQPELLCTRVAVEELPGEEQRGGRDDAVHRHEQVRRGRADRDVDSHGHAEQDCERKHERPAAQEHRADRGEGEPDHGCGRQQWPVPVRQQVDGEQNRSERPGAERGQALHARRRHEEDGEPGRADNASGPCELGHGVTTTTAWATCPPAETRST